MVTLVYSWRGLKRGGCTEGTLGVGCLVRGGVRGPGRSGKIRRIHSMIKVLDILNSFRTKKELEIWLNYKCIAQIVEEVTGNINNRETNVKDDKLPQQKG